MKSWTSDRWGENDALDLLIVVILSNPGIGAQRFTDGDVVLHRLMVCSLILITERLQGRKDRELQNGWGREDIIC